MRSKAEPGAAAVDLYLSTKDPNLQQLARQLRAFVGETLPDATLAVNQWGIPTFDLRGPLCYFMVGKRHVTFGFFRGTAVDDPKRMLEGTGKNLRHVKVRKPEDLTRSSLRGLLLAAAKLNRNKPAR